MLKTISEDIMRNGNKQLRYIKQTALAFVFVCLFVTCVAMYFMHISRRSCAAKWYTLFACDPQVVVNVACSIMCNKLGKPRLMHSAMFARP